MHKSSSIVALNHLTVQIDVIKPITVRNNNITYYASGSAWAIDLDDGSSNYEVYENVAWELQSKLDQLVTFTR